jgi:hypothetical protein
MPGLLKNRRAWRALFGFGFLVGLFILGFLGIFSKRATIIGPSLEPVAILPEGPMEEVSGLVKSSSYDDILWAHNDSGNAPRLFALDSAGTVVNAGIEVKDATLKDWEAIARLGNRLYIAEMGNNLNASRTLGLYEIDEPDPRVATEVTPNRFIGVRYPDQTGFPPSDRWEFDCEAAFGFEGALYFITKNRPPFRVFVQKESANLYKLDLENLQEDNLLEPVDTVSALGGWATACDISRQGRWLAVLIESPLQSIWLFERPRQGDKFFTDATSVRRFVFHNGGQLESLAFTEYQGQEALVMLNEQREMFRVTLDQFGPVEK